MENKKSIFIIIGLIIALVILFLVGGFDSMGISKKPSKETNEMAQAKMSELAKLVIEDHDCSKVVTEAVQFLRHNESFSDIWNILGICQFDLGRFEEAKISFEKVISLDPTHEGAKTYIETIAKINDGSAGTVLAAAEIDLTQADFEAIANLKFANLSFDRAFEKPANIPKYIVGKYVSSTTFNNTASYISNELTKKNLTFSTSTAQLKSGFAFGNENELTSILVEGGTNVLVTIIYQKIK